MNKINFVLDKISDGICGVLGFVERVIGVLVMPLTALHDGIGYLLNVAIDKSGLDRGYHDFRTRTQ